jgi:hypothetical protein
VYVRFRDKLVGVLLLFVRHFQPSKILAVSSFWEAKRIKNKYMIEDDDTDDEYENTEDYDVDYSDDTDNDKTTKSSSSDSDTNN